MSTGYTVSVNPAVAGLGGGQITFTISAVSTPFSGGEQISGFTSAYGTFGSPSGGSFSGGTFTLPPGASATIVFTAGSGSVGTATALTTTNNQGWTDPSPTTFYVALTPSQTDIAAAFFGPFNDQTAGSRYWEKLGSYFRLLITGTDAYSYTADNYGGSTGFVKVRVDGGSWVDPPVYTNYTMFTGLSNVEHTVEVYVQQASIGNFRTPSTGQLLIIYGSNVSYRLDPALGAYKRFCDATWKGVVSGKPADDGSGNSTNTYFVGDQGDANHNMQVKFRCTSTGGFYLQGANPFGAYAIDGVHTGTFTGENLVQVASSLTSGEHEICLTVSGSNGAGITDGIVLAAGGSFSSTAEKPTRLAIMGDSIARGEGVLTTGEYGIDVFFLGERIPVAAIDFGVSGEHAAETVTKYSGRVSGYSFNATDILLLEIGFNDTATGTSSFQSSYSTLITDGLATGFGRIVCRSIEPPHNTTMDPQIQAVVATFSATVDADGLPKVVYSDIYTGTKLTALGTNAVEHIIDNSTNGGWGTPPWSYDGTHPSEDGYVAMADVQTASMSTTAAQLFPASTITLSGPTSGTVGLASTFTWATNGYFNPGTLTLAGTGGTFSPSSPIVISDGTTQNTFTFTPSAAGNHNVSISATVGTNSLATSGSPITLSAASGTGFAIVAVADVTYDAVQGDSVLVTLLGTGSTFTTANFTASNATLSVLAQSDNTHAQLVVTAQSKSTDTSTITIGDGTSTTTITAHRKLHLILPDNTLDLVQGAATNVTLVNDLQTWAANATSSIYATNSTFTSASFVNDGTITLSGLTAATNGIFDIVVYVSDGVGTALRLASPPATANGGNFTTITNNTNAQVIYVSSINGSNSNTGTDSSHAVATLAKVRSLQSGGNSFVIIGERGSVFHEAFGGFDWHGNSVTSPSAMKTYGTGPRPKVIPPANTDAMSIGAQNFAIQGWHFYNETGDPSSGNYTHQDNTGAGISEAYDHARSNLLIEDCQFGWFGAGLTIQGYNAGVINNVTVRRNIITDQYKTNGDHSSGYFFNQVTGLRKEQNTILRNGYNNSIPGADPTIFNHGDYTQYSNLCVTSRENIIVLSSDTGEQLRPGGISSGDLFDQNPIGILLAAENISGYPCSDTICDGLFVLEGNDLGATAVGWGVNINSDARRVTLSNFIIANTLTTANSYPIQVQPGASGVTITDGIVYNWPSGSGSAVTDYGINTIITNLTTSNPGFIDPSRNLASYDATLGGPGTTANFLASLESRGPGVWSDTFSAVGAQSYLRQGFSVSNTETITISNTTGGGDLSYVYAYPTIFTPGTLPDGPMPSPWQTGGLNVIPTVSNGRIGTDQTAADALGFITTSIDLSQPFTMACNMKAFGTADSSGEISFGGGDLASSSNYFAMRAHFDAGDLTLNRVGYLFLAVPTATGNFFQTASQSINSLGENITEIKSNGTDMTFSWNGVGVGTLTIHSFATIPSTAFVKFTLGDTRDTFTMGNLILAPTNSTLRGPYKVTITQTSGNPYSVSNQTPFVTGFSAAGQQVTSGNTIIIYDNYAAGAGTITFNTGNTTASLDALLYPQPMSATISRDRLTVTIHCNVPPKPTTADKDKVHPSDSTAVNSATIAASAIVVVLAAPLTIGATLSLDAGFFKDVNSNDSLAATAMPVYPPVSNIVPILEAIELFK